MFNFTTPQQSLGYFIPDVIQKLKKNKKEKDIFFSNLNQKREFSHIDDVCLALNLMLKNNKAGPVNISSGNKIVLKNLVKLIMKKMNLKIKLKTDNKRINLIPSIHKLKQLGFKPKRIFQIFLEILKKKCFYL